MAVKLYDYQYEAIQKLESGKILCGGVGTGKTLTALHFYLLYFRKQDLIVITTAKKRDSKDWEREAKLCGIDDICVDSWNNIKKYRKKQGFYIFDEQRVGGYGTWAKSFIEIAKKNKWILLSATPGDVWTDYISVFVANGFYRNKTDFIRQHVEFDRFAKYPKIKAYHNERKLRYFRSRVLVMMKGDKKTIRNRKYVWCEYNKKLYFETLKNRWDIYQNKPIENPSRLTQIARRIVAEDESRIKACGDILKESKKVIVFYNYDYELEILEQLCQSMNRKYSQWNGHKHEDILKEEEWAYLVHYSASEAWNCIETNKVIFYSLNYSYKVKEQAEGRIDRMNTPYKDLYYYYLLSKASIDNSVLASLNSKKKFNEESWGKEN